MIVTFGIIATNVSSFVLDVAKSYFSNIAKEKVKELAKSEFSEYQKELSNIIGETMRAYAIAFPTIDDNKTYFFHSEVFLKELLKFRLTSSVDKNAILNAIENDDRIVIPTSEEIEKFLEFFDIELKKSNKINNLFIESNYKEEIFKLQGAIQDLSNQLPNILQKEFSKFKQEIHSNYNRYLFTEWSKQIDDIREYVFSFKPKTSLNLLISLEKRINENGGFEDKMLQARITYFKGFCKSEILNEDEKKEVAQVFISAYNLSPFNKDYKHVATLGYYILGDLECASKMGEEMIQEDPFDATGWIIRCFLNEKPFEEFYILVPEIVKAKAIFKINIFNWVLSSKKIISISKMDQLNIGFPIDSLDIPSKISLLNREYWLSVCNYLLGKFNEDTQITRVVALLDEGEKTQTLVICNKILKLIYENLISTEIENKFSFYFYAYYYTNHLLEGGINNIFKMEEYYIRITKITHQIVFSMAKTYASINTDEGIFKAIKCIDDFNSYGNADLLLLKSIYQFWDGKIDESFKTILQYANIKEAISEKELFNILQFIFSHTKSQNKLSVEFITTILTKTFDPPNLVGILKLLFSNMIGINFNKEEIIQETIEISKELEKNSSLRCFIAIIYFNSNLEDNAISYLKEYIDFEKPSLDLKLYCEAIYKSTISKKVDLMPILEKWRKSFYLDYDLLNIELYLKESQNKWAESLEIAEFIFKHFNDEYSLNQIFICALNASLNDKIHEYAYIIQNREIRNEDILIHISEAIFRSDLPELALELMYNKAIGKHNIKTREAFFHASIKYPAELYITYDSVQEDRFVTYNINEKIEILHFTKEKANDPRYINFIGKKASDVVKIKQPLSQNFIEAKIIRVVNKYLALLDEIMSELNNPLHGYEIQVLKFESNDFESMEKVFIEQFGVESNLNIERINENIRKYNKGDLCFSEIAYSVFRNSLFDAYFHLTSDNSNCFRALTTVWSQAPEPKECVFVLDATSLCLFYELSKDISIDFKEKFVISTFLKEELKNAISKIESDAQSELSITITKDTVIPHFKSEEEEEKKIDYFKNILEWAERNCEEINVEERINMASPDAENLINQRFWNVQIDCRLLIDRPNYYLLTNDLFFIRIYKSPQNKIISPEAFIEKYYKKYHEDVIKYLIDKKYIGIAINRRNIMNEYLKFSQQKENRYSVCIENLNFAWNPNEANISELILFLKELYLLNSIGIQSKNQAAQTLLLSLINGMNSNQITVVRNQIEKEFSLMGMLKDAVLIELINALQIISMRNK